jgi:hypothetical protein
MHMGTNMGFRAQDIHILKGLRYLNLLNKVIYLVVVVHHLNAGGRNKYVVIRNLVISSKPTLPFTSYTQYEQLLILLSLIKKCAKKCLTSPTQVDLS